MKPTTRRSNVECCNCQRYGHLARECGNYASLNFQGASRGNTDRYVDSPETSKPNRDTNSDSDVSHISYSSLPEHQFVACFIDGVLVNALLDTGSMKSFIGDRIHKILDFDCVRLDKLQSLQRCTSITGGDVNIAVLVQSQLKGVNKVILSEGVSISVRSEIIIEGKIQAKVISQVGMISASKSDSVRQLKGLHVAHLVVTPAGKTVPIRIANTTTEDIEISKGCKLAEFCALIEQEIVDNNNFPVNCNAVDNIDSSPDPGLSNSEKQHVK